MPITDEQRRILRLLERGRFVLELLHGEWFLVTLPTPRIRPSSVRALERAGFLVRFGHERRYHLTVEGDDELERLDAPTAAAS